MSQLQKFKNLIKEAVREVLQEELGNTHSFPKNTPNTSISIHEKKSVQPKISNNPIESILQETANSMTKEDFQNSSLGEGGNPPQFQMETQHTPVVSSINEMSNSKTLNESQVQITAVPDFSEFMKAMDKK